MSSLKGWVWPAVYGVGITALLIAALAYIVQQKPMTAYVLPTPILAEINRERAERLRSSRNASVFIYADIPDKRLYDDPTTPDAFRDGRAFGSGVVTSGGRILTAAHVVESICMRSMPESSTEVYCAVVGVGHKKVYRAKLVKIAKGVPRDPDGDPTKTAGAPLRYPEGDQAELQIVAENHRETFAAVPVIDSIFDTQLEGREVLINGMPFGFVNMAVSGMVSNAPDHDEVCGDEEVRITIAAGSGNSGGAVFDIGTGALIGIVATVQTVKTTSNEILFLHIMCAVSPQKIRAFLK